MITINNLHIIILLIIEEVEGKVKCLHYQQEQALVRPDAPAALQAPAAALKKTQEPQVGSVNIQNLANLTRKDILH